MKFTKKQANEELVKLLTAKGEELNLSVRSIDEDLETLIPVLVNDETELTDFVKQVLPIFNTANKNVRTNVSEGIRAYKEKNPVQTPPVEPKPTEDETELEKRLKALEDAYNKAALENQTRSAKESLKKTIKEKGVKNDVWIDAMMSKVVVGDNFDVDTEATSYVDLYNQMMASYKPNATPNQATGVTDTYISDSIKAASELAKSQNLTMPNE